MIDSMRVTCARVAAIAFMVLLACSSASCASDGAKTTPQLPAGASAPTPSSSANGGRSAGAIAGSVSVGEPTRDAYCAGKGPPVGITQPQAGGQSCTTGLASRIFEHGLCTCKDAVFTGAFSIDGFDSTRSAKTSAQAAQASVGTNGEFTATGLVDIHGSLIAAGTHALPITSGGYNIDGNFETNSDLFVTGANIRFGRDLWVNGAITAVGLSTVSGNVYQTAGHALVGMSIGGKLYQQAFQVPDPCACRDDQLLDIDAIVAAGTASNHNSALGLSSAAVFNIGSGSALDLACGRFAFGDFNVVGAGVIKAQGRTALFIDGDLTITGSFGVDVGASGELDVFVTRNLLITGAAAIGSRDRPAALRFYVGGGGDIAITGATQFAANLYAPRSNVFVTGADEVYGAFFVGSYTATGAQIMHYDSAILDTTPADGCPPPVEHCALDLDCGSSQWCSAGSCTSLAPD